MVECNNHTEPSANAEKKKNEGNNEFKKGNYHAAIEYYTDAIDIKPHETYYSNRAASLIAIKEFRRAMEDCKLAIRLNPDFARTFKRLFKCHLMLGHVS